MTVVTFKTYREAYGIHAFGLDAHAYWMAWQGQWRTEMYDLVPGMVDAFNYSPAFALLIWPWAQLPWPVAFVLWTAACIAGLTWLIRPLGWKYVPPLLLFAVQEIVSGNIFWVLAIVAVLGTTGRSSWRAAAWSVAALTKLTPALGPVWFLFRGEWLKLAAAAVSTFLIVGASYLVVPDLWHQWASFLLDNEASGERVGHPLFPPLAVRLPLGLVLLAWGARTNRIWTLPVAMVLATPVAGVASFMMLYAIPRLMADTADTAGAAPDTEAPGEPVTGSGRGDHLDQKL